MSQNERRLIKITQPTNENDLRRTHLSATFRPASRINLARFSGKSQRRTAFRPQREEVERRQDRLRHFQDDLPGVTYDFGGDVDHRPAQRGGISRQRHHLPANVFLEGLVEEESRQKCKVPSFVTEISHKDLVFSSANQAFGAAINLCCATGAAIQCRTAGGNTPPTIS